MMSIGIKRENDSDMETSSTTSVDDQLCKKLEELQKELNLDEEIIKNSWESYQEISRKCTLGGKQLHWFACSLFVRCRNTNAQTVDKHTAKANPISMTTLLRLCDLSLKQFFENMKKWIKMANLSKDFYKDIDAAEKNFFVCKNVFKSYIVLFKKIFKAPDHESIRHRKKLTQCTPVQVFEFTWLLFILMKGKYLACANDLVECLYILQCCCNLSFKNAFMSNMRELLNPEFDGLPPNWHLPGYQLPKKAPCVIDKLGTQQQLANVAYVQEHKLQQHLAKLIQDHQLKGNKDDFTNLFLPANFDYNYSKLAKMYEQFIMQEGCYDEKIFLAEAYGQSVLQMTCSNGDTITDTPINNRRSLVPETPLTGRQYVGPRDTNDNSIDSQNKLRTLLESRPSGMSNSLSELVAECGDESLNEKVVNIAQTLGQKFMNGITMNGTADEEKHTFGSKLFYYLLEMILSNEKKINKDISLLLKMDIFLECIFVCAVEIVVFSFNMSKPFPWVLKCLEVPAAHFVRVIELVVRCNDQFSRNTIKHLSYVEETILESLMWRLDSVLWEDLARTDYEIPKFEEIARPGTLNLASMPSTSTTPRALFGAGLTLASPSISDAFQSPRYSTIRPGQSLLNPNRNQLAVQNTSNGNTPKSFSIIFRKFYVLAGVRLEHICSKLGLTETEVRMKIWTMFEYSIRETKLIQNRHLDQLIMCAVYIICKVCMIQKNFTDIMECYRFQPQARSTIYREVYIENKKSDDLITFYNTIYMKAVKSCVKLFAQQASSIDSLTLSPLPANKPLVSPRSQVTRNVYVNPLESPSNFNSPAYSYYFNRSDSRDLKNINKAINGKTVKRLLTDGEERDSKRFANRKLQDLIEEREVQSTI